MEKWLGLDSKFYKWGTLLADLIIITVLWLICSLPLITIGASTTAIYYITTRQLSNREGYVTRDFWKSFKANFIQGTIVTVIFILILTIVGINISILDRTTLLGTCLFYIQFVVLYEVIIVGIYIFPILSRFELKIFELFKTAIFMANRHLLTTITAIAVLIALCLIVLRVPILIFLCTGVYAILTSLMFMSLFKKYVPTIDTDSENM